MKYFKVYGERRSGTKFLREHIKINTNLTWISDHWKDPLGWKHGQLDIQDIKNSGYINNTLFCLVVKHPLSWLVSMYRNPPHMEHMKELLFEDFLFSEWDESNIMDKRGNPAPDKYKRKYENIFKLREYKLQSHLQIQTLPNHRIFKVEDIFAGKEFEKAIPTETNFSMLSDVREYYKNEEWRQMFSDELIEKIKSQLNIELEHQIGYELT